jgi:DNA-directed RNA polymerase sigma subunit (sigma70/sigma32)
MRTIVSRNETTAMIHDTISKIENRLAQSAVKDESKAELAELLGTLKAEVAELSKTNTEAAQSIAGFTQVSAHEATREEPNPALLEHSLSGLSASVEGFEKSHPRLVDIVNRLCTTLSNLGI